MQKLNIKQGKEKDYLLEDLRMSNSLKGFLTANGINTLLEVTAFGIPQLSRMPGYTGELLDELLLLLHSKNMMHKLSQWDKTNHHS